MNETERIIGDSLEIYSDLIKDKNDESNKKPKFIKNIIFKRYHKKLVKIVKKMYNANKPLTRANLAEYFTYIFNNYPPYGTFKHVSVVKMLQSSIVAVFKLDNIKAKFIIREDEKTFNLVLAITNPNTEVVSNYDINLETLYSDDTKFKDKLESINNSIHKDIADYILDAISLDNVQNENEV